MKPNFALSLSFDGLRLMHRVADGWHLVGQVALDDADVTGALAALRTTAEGLEPAGISTKLLIPNDQIKYLALDTTRAEEDEVRAALHGATPYAVDELTYDFAKGGGRTYVAAVAKETLAEAQQFATEHGFNPVSFAAVPEPFTYVGEAFFGATEGKTAERDAEPVIVTGTVDTALIAPAPEAQDADKPEPETAPEAENVAQDEAVPVDAPQDEPAAVETEEAADETPDVETLTEADAEDTIDTQTEPASDDTTGSSEAAEPDDVVVPDNEDIDASGETETSGEEDASENEAPSEDIAPVFAPRLRADRNEGRPAAPSAAPDQSEAPKFGSRRAEPTFSRPPLAPLAVPTGQGTDAMPPVSAPGRDTTPDTVPAPTITALEADTPAAAPAITGEAATAVPADKAAITAPIAVETANPEPEKPEETSKSAGAAALGAATAVGGAVGGMFASRRMARAEAKAKASETASEEKSSRSVFGARKQPKPKPVVGGKPRFLGLILTAVLLLFLLAIGVFAAVSDEGFARWFGFGSSDTQIANDPENTPPANTAADPAASEVAALTPDDADASANAPDALASPTAPTGGQVLSPEEATRIYAATGVWQRAPRIPLTPRTTTLETMALGAPGLPVPRVPPSPLASASSVAGDALIATPIDPPAPDETFNFGSDGLVVATPDGAVTPDGIVVIVGRPPLNPPTRPGTIAPEITPQDQLAAVIPEEAAPAADAPEGVIVINGRPAIEPPVRTGTAAPAPAPEAAAIASGTAPLLATDGLLVLAGTPPVLPPLRPGTVAAAVTPVQPEPAPQPVPEITETIPEEPLPETGTPQPEGLNVIAGAPPVLPPARPGTVAPQANAAVENLTSDVTAALDSGTAQTPTTDTPRPLPRPAALIEAAALAANSPVLGALTVAEATAFRPRTRPAGLAPVPVEPDPIPEEAAAPAEQPEGLQISPEIAAAVLAAANRPNPIVNPTAQAVATSERPDTRPRNMARIVARAAAAQERAATQVAAVPRAAAVAPSGPTAGSVAQNATLENAINLREVNLIGIFGGNNDRRALVRLSNGRYVRVTVGDRLDGGRVTAISASALSYTKRGRAVTLQVAG